MKLYSCPYKKYEANSQKKDKHQNQIKCLHSNSIFTVSHIPINLPEIVTLK